MGTPYLDSPKITYLYIFYVFWFFDISKGGFIFCIFFAILVISKREDLSQCGGVYFRMVYSILDILVIFCHILHITVIFCIFWILRIFNIFPIFGVFCAENDFLAGYTMYKNIKHNISCMISCYFYNITYDIIYYDLWYH